MKILHWTASLHLPWVLIATNNAFNETETTETPELVSQDPGCLNGTESGVDGYYISLGTCNNHPVYMRQNSTIFSSNIDSTYILYYGDVSNDITNTYGFYWCETKESYSINGETDNNDDNSEDCAHPGNMMDCNDEPDMYCSQYSNDDYYQHFNTSDGLPTFFDYCGQFKWKKYDSSKESGEGSSVNSVIFYPNSYCHWNSANNDGIPDSTSNKNGDSEIPDSQDDSNPNELSEELTNAWVVLGVIIGVIIVIIGFVAMLKRGKTVWERTRARIPVILPMSGKDSIRNRELELDEDEDDDREDEMDEELGAVIVSGKHKKIHKNRHMQMKQIHHVPDAPAPPIPIGASVGSGVGGGSSSNIKNEMLHESMIDDSETLTHKHTSMNGMNGTTKHRDDSDGNRNRNKDISNSHIGSNDSSGTYHSKHLKKIKSNDDDSD